MYLTYGQSYMHNLCNGRVHIYLYFFMVGPVNHILYNVYFHSNMIQQDHLIAEIEKYGSPNSDSDRMVFQYLKAMNLLFEYGLLCAEHIATTEAAALQRIEKDSSFSVTGKDDVIAHGE